MLIYKSLISSNTSGMCLYTTELYTTEGDGLSIECGELLLVYDSSVKYRWCPPRFIASTTSGHYLRVLTSQGRIAFIDHKFIAPYESKYTNPTTLLALCCTLSTIGTAACKYRRRCLNGHRVQLPCTLVQDFL